MTLGERIDLAREALAQGLAPLPIVLSALEIPRATWYYYRKQKVEADRKREEEERRLKRAIEEILLEHPEYGYRRVTEELHSARTKLVEGNPRQPQAGPPPASGLPPLPEAHRPEAQAQSLAGDRAFGRGQGGPEGLASQAKGTGTL
jgi:hypothetical protein